MDDPAPADDGPPWLLEDDGGLRIEVGSRLEGWGICWN